jgi:hypothetical protein
VPITQLLDAEDDPRQVKSEDGLIHMMQEIFPASQGQ